MKARRVLKLFLPFIVLILSIAISYFLGVIAEGDKVSVPAVILQNVIELAVCAALIFVCLRVYPKLFAGSERYRISKPDFALAAGLMLMLPAFRLAANYIIYRSFVAAGHVFAPESLVYENAAELREDMLLGINAVLIAPLFEELTFRYMTLTPYRRRLPRMIVVIFISAVFGLLHSKNCIMAASEAVIFSAVFLITKDLSYSVLLHAAGNLFSVCLGITSYFGITDIKYAAGFPLVMVFDRPTAVVFTVLAVFGALLLTGRSIRRKRAAVSDGI